MGCHYSLVRLGSSEIVVVLAFTDPVAKDTVAGVGVDATATAAEDIVGMGSTDTANRLSSPERGGHEISARRRWASRNDSHVAVVVAVAAVVRGSVLGNVVELPRVAVVLVVRIVGSVC